MPNTSCPDDIASVSIDDLGATMVLRMAGEIDASTDDVVSGPLFACLDTAPQSVIIDMTNVEFIGSTGLNMLVRAYQTARSRAVRLLIVEGTHAVARAVEVSGLDAYLPLSRSLSDALSSVGVGGNVDAGR